jgi:hypothetical protein
MATVTEPTTTTGTFAPELDGILEVLETARKAPGHSWADVTNELSRVSKLSDDWDGQGADAPSPETVELARTAISRMRKEAWPSPSFVRATPAGEIAFEWIHDSDLILEAEVSELGIEYTAPRPGLPLRTRFVPYA